jgi:hypothetical protein
MYSDQRTTKKKQDLGRSNRLLYLIRHGPNREQRVQQYGCVCIRCSGNVLTEPLPSSDKGIRM